MTQEISIITAFIAGFLSFLAPCILPLIPPYFAWLLGISGEDDFKKKRIRAKIFFNSLFLVLGFSLVFIVLGAGASFLGQVLAPYRLTVQRMGGLLIILFGLKFVGFFKIFGFNHGRIIKKLFSKFSRKTGSFLIGTIFAFSWVACFGPILGSILVFASFQETLKQGIILLSFYSLGLCIPFLLSSLLIGFLIDKIKLITKITKWINLFSGLVLIILGILLFTDNFYKIVIWLYNL